MLTVVTCPYCNRETLDDLFCHSCGAVIDVVPCGC